MSANLSASFYLVSGILFILALRGLSSPETSRQGNYFGIAGMTISIIVTFLSVGNFGPGFIYVLIFLLIGGSIGAFIAFRIPMTAMPELVAGFHSLVGLAAVFVAISAYLKAIEVKADYFDANYNLGALYFNQAVQGINKANDMWKPNMPSKEAAAQKKLETQAKELFNTAKPYLETAFSVNSEDVQTIRSLKDIYLRLEEDDKFLQMNDLLKKSQQ